MTPEQIQAAIDWAKQPTPPKPYVLQSRPEPITTDPEGRPLPPNLARYLREHPTPPTVYGTLYTPFVRVALAARAAQESYKPFMVADVPTTLLEPLVYVVVLPFEKTGNRLDRFVDAEHVVILPNDSRDPARAVQPVWVKPDTSVLQNAFGARVETNGIVAAFPPSALKPDHDFVFIYKRPIVDGFDSATQQRLTIRQQDLTAWK